MSDDRRDLEERLAETLAEVLHVDVPSRETDLIRTGRLDSVGLVDLLLRLERTYGVRVEMEDLEIDQFRSLGTITAFVAARMESASTAAR
ncbi:MAG TPA: acyl carrier protein [Gemmatimonadales bacterium]|jgi:acyl carrier protein|nr:acyl carrier protein [Gemmatimonadales bacterium]